MVGDGEKSVALGGVFAPGRGVGFGLTSGDGEIGDERVRGFAGAVGDHGRVAVVVAERDGGEGLGDGSDLVEFEVVLGRR